MNLLDAERCAALCSLSPQGLVLLLFLLLLVSKQTQFLTEPTMALTFEPSLFHVSCLTHRFLCLEFSQVSQPLLRQLYDAYSFAVIPRIGGIVAGDADSYQYLVESIRQFPDQVRSCGLWMCVSVSVRVTFSDLYLHP